MKSFDKKAASSWWGSLSNEEKINVLQVKVPLIYGFLRDRFTAKYAKIKGLTLATTQQDFEELIQFLLVLRGMGPVNQTNLFKAYRTKNELKLGSTVKWTDPKSPLTIWYEDAVSAFAGPSNEGTYVNTTLISGKVPKSLILSTNNTLVNWSIWMLKTQRKLIDSLDDKNAESVKVTSTHNLSFIRDFCSKNMVYILYMGGRTRSISATCIGSFNAAGG